MKFFYLILLLSPLIGCQNHALHEILIAEYPDIAIKETRFFINVSTPTDTRQFLIDTGATTTVIPPEYLQELLKNKHASVSTEIVNVRAAGTQKWRGVKVYHLDWLKVGDCKLDNVRFISVPEINKYIIGSTTINRLLPMTFDLQALRFTHCV